MINSVQPVPTQRNNRTSILTVGDVHGKLTNQERIYTASKAFDAFVPSQPTDKLKLATGDIILGLDLKANTASNKFLDWCGFIANNLGNHEMDVLPENLSKLFKSAKYKTLACNINIVPNSLMNGTIEKSMVYVENGTPYGIIGIAPSDYKDRVKPNKTMEEISVDDFETTIKDVQQEVDKLKAKGVNRIILLSHSGFGNDQRIAQETSGIDIILGGHTHNTIEGVKEGVNLFYSKSGEPVVITQYGKDGENIGKLDVEWDDVKGVITKVQNSMSKTREEFRRTLPMKYAIETIIGKPEILGKVSKADPAPKNRLISPNAHANFIVDSMRGELGTEIAILNSGNIRGNFSEETVDSRLIKDITPFKDDMIIANLSEPNLVHILKQGAKSMVNVGNKPGIIIPSGFKYDITKSGEIRNLRYIDKNNNEVPIDINNPNPNKIYKTAMDDFVAKGGDDYLPKNDHPAFIEQTFKIDKDKLACERFKKLDQPVEITDDGRIKIVEG